MSLMHVFRDAAARGDARVRDSQKASGETDLTIIGQKRREGASEEALRRNLAQDIASLMNTIRFDVCVALDEYPRISRSIINHGFQDMDTLWRQTRTQAALADAIRQSLMQSEPRLRADLIDVVPVSDEPTADQRLSFNITAEMISNPHDIPVRFLAEIDPGAGKIAIRRTQGDA
ncbi:MAG: GPW/gp25 family protein [Paracoccus sp. (in: a-proteobacteria)]|uniref:type VI secretion system baseplate subunit TssE n=1 Tax=Paracoccus sp. TaxID=267 RepID=UPI0026DEAF39|nr:GPW/gp25 family protein [Paracoccus sp. (in: a-proteobacteria)]MDO5622919.1 GPW/gp25 family protein [Paracoccus sp. (in: a-proteobacteria)]